MYKRYFFLSLILFALSLGLVGVVVFIVDPYFHYRTPSFNYSLISERYQNNGILKNFEYDAVITGTSMTENFKSSEFERLFNCRTIKVSNSGATYKETHDRLLAGFSSSNNIKYVLLGLDSGESLAADKNAMNYLDLPEYLYNDSPFDDYMYLLSKDNLALSVNNVIRTILKKETKSFDDFGYWAEPFTFGKEAMDSIYTRKEKTSISYPLTEEELQVMYDNLKANVISLVVDNPSTTFLIFIPPYSIYFFDKQYTAGTLEKQLDLEKKAIELLLQYDNVRLFSFFDDFDLVTNLDNYTDSVHYGPWINSEILLAISKGEHLITKDNFEEYCRKERDFYLNYDYDKLFNP